MALNLWISHGEQWLDDDKVSFNGITKSIQVNAGVTALDVQTELYSAWIRWFERIENTQYLPAMRFTGLDPIPGGQTGGTFFTINGWKVVYDPRVVAISGILYSDDYSTPYYFTDGSPVFPATVSGISLSGAASIDYAQLGVAIADNFAEPEMTTAGVATAVGADSTLGTKLTTINEGIKKASILIPHTTDMS